MEWPGEPGGLRISSSAALVGAAVERLLHAVTDEVDQQHDEDDRGAGKVEEPPGGAGETQSLTDEQTERRVGWLDAESEERKRRLKADGACHVRRGDDGDGADEVGEQVTAQDAAC